MSADELNALRDRNRRLEAENEELLRDYRDLCALDPDGLRARIVDADDRTNQQKAYVDQLRESLAEECARSAAFWTELVPLREHADAVASAEIAAELKADIERLSDANAALQAIVDDRLGVPAANLIAEYRSDIRDLTFRLNDALAELDAAKAREKAARAEADAYRPDAVFVAMREGRTVDVGCSRDPSRVDICKGGPLPACASCGAIEDGPCVYGVDPVQLARATAAATEGGVVNPYDRTLELAKRRERDEDFDRTVRYVDFLERNP